MGKWGKQKQSELHKTYQYDPTEKPKNSPETSKVEANRVKELEKSKIKDMDKKTEITASKWNKPNNNSSQSSSKYMDPIHNVKHEHDKKIVHE